jgi:hypothetical protein
VSTFATQLCAAKAGEQLLFYTSLCAAVHAAGFSSFVSHPQKATPASAPIT